jgi:hypothetical protein
MRLKLRNRSSSWQCTVTASTNKIWQDFLVRFDRSASLQRRISKDEIIVTRTLVRSGGQNFGRIQGTLSCRFKILSLFKCMKWFWSALLIWIRVSNFFIPFTRTTRTIDSIPGTSHLCIVYWSERIATAKINTLVQSFVGELPCK